MTGFFKEKRENISHILITGVKAQRLKKTLQDLKFSLFIGGFNICGKNQAKGTRGDCKPAYKSSLHKDKNKDVSRSERESERPRPKNLRKYLQSRHRF